MPNSSCPLPIVVIAWGETPKRTCFGLACPLRLTCLRYLAIDFSPGASTTQATCQLDGTYPDYLYAMSPEHQFPNAEHLPEQLRRAA